MDKNIPAAGGELPPVQLTFVNPEGVESADAMPESEELDAQSTPRMDAGPGAKRLQEAGKEVMKLMGVGDAEIEAAMKPKAAIATAADAFVAAGKKAAKTGED